MDKDKLNAALKKAGVDAEVDDVKDSAVGGNSQTAWKLKKKDNAGAARQVIIEEILKSAPGFEGADSTAMDEADEKAGYDAYAIKRK